MPVSKYSSLLTIISAWICGIAFAIGHHFFYHNLNGRVLESSRSWTFSSYKVSSQQINVSLGTFFAFLVKALLGISMSTVFSQITWKAIKARTTTIAIIDDLFSVLSNALFIGNVKLWYRYPTAMILACIIWLLPLASIITPATLNVEMSANYRSSMVADIPRVDFTSFQIASFSADEGVKSGFSYQGPDYHVQKVVAATTAQGEILPITPPSSNSSWELDFHGPALSCQNVNDALHKSIMDNMKAVVNQSFNGSSGIFLGPFNAWGYLSWTPDPNKTAPFIQFNLSNTAGYNLRGGSLGPQNDSQLITQSPLSLFVATFPEMESPDDSVVDTDIYLQELQNQTILQCTLHNASYTTQFNYTNGDQKIHTARLDLTNEIGYLGGMGGQWTEGLVYKEDYNATMIEMFSYQAIMEAFGDLLVGSIAKTAASGLPVLNTTDTKVMQTLLTDTKELAFLKNATNNDTAGFNDLWGSNSSALLPTLTDYHDSLAESLERLFQNITLSLMSVDQLQPNFSSPLAPPPVNVTFTTYHNIYVYSQSILWLAYGIAIAVCSLSVLLGLYAHIVNRGSYTTRFSTILRTTHDASLSAKIEQEDMHGKDPRPDYIGQATITFWSGQENEKILLKGDESRQSCESDENREDHKSYERS